MLELQDVRVAYGSIDALRGVSLSVHRGEIVALIGANGAGKSTTLMSVSGVAALSGGVIYYNGIQISGRPSHEIVRLGVSQVPEGRRIFPRMTVRENLEMGAFSRSKKELSEEIGRIYDMFPALAERSRQSGGTLSGGEQQMLAIGRALMSTPRILLLDEPSLGLAPILVNLIFTIIQEINRQGVAILLVEQNAHQALALAQRGYVLETGAISAHGTSEELQSDRRIQEAYLGGAGLNAR